MKKTYKTPLAEVIGFSARGVLMSSIDGNLGNMDQNPIIVNSIDIPDDLMLF